MFYKIYLRYENKIPKEMQNILKYLNRYLNIWLHIKYLGTRIFVYKYFPKIFLFFKFGSIKNINQEEYWNSIHKNENNHEITRFGGTVYKILNKNIEFNDKSVLDVGCGNGEFLFSIDEKCSKYGIDISINAVENLEKKGITAKKCILPNIDFNKKFDIITCFETLEHVKPWRKSIIEMINILKKNGYLIISVPFEDKIVMHEHVNYFDVHRLYKFLKNKINVLEIKIIGPWILIVAQKNNFNPKVTEKIPNYHIRGISK